MKKGLSLFASMALMTASLMSQAATEPVQVAAKNNIMVGAGAINGMYIVVRNADKLQSSDSSFFAGITTNSVKPLYFIKYEYKLAERHTLGVNFANSGFVIGGLVKDSFFVNDLGILTQTQVDVIYRSRSFNLRYNYLFNTNESFQVYWGLGIGVRGNSISLKTNNPELSKLIDIPGLNVASVPVMGFESTLGFRGKIQEHLGWYAEMGMARALFQAGLSYRF